MIEVQDLCKNYGTRPAISNLNFSIQKGDVVGFLGPNGAGKSTTMKIITGFMAPSSGSARIAGYDVFENPIEVKKRIGYLPEIPPVYGEMYVKDYLKYVAQLKKVPQSDLAHKVERALNKTQLNDVKNRLIQNLSKGFRQRVGIAQAIVSDPEILILDEPTVGLDPKQVAEIRDLIKELKGQHTIVLSTHILPEVQATCEKIIIINKGQIVAQDSIHNLSQIEKGKRRLSLRLRPSNPLTANEIADKLKQVSGVLSVQTGATLQDWVLELGYDESIIESVANAVVQSGWGLLQLTPTQMDLEDVFLKLTYGQQGAQS